MKRMNIWMLSALLALPASAQKITTQHEVVDCGQVVFHKPVTAEFVLKNDGHKPLVINNVLKSCGCTEVDYPKTSIAALRKFRHQGGIRCQADGYFHQAGLPLYQCG